MCGILPLRKGGLKISKRIFKPSIPSIKKYIPDNWEELETSIKEDKKKEIQKHIKEKYVKPIQKREKEYKKNAYKEWFWTKGATLLNLLLALIAAITGIISLLK